LWKLLADGAGHTFFRMLRSIRIRSFSRRRREISAAVSRTQCRRIKAQRRSQIPPSTPPIAQHRRRDAQLPRDLRRRPTAAHQQRHRFPLEIICKSATSLHHSTPLRSLRRLAKVSTNAGEASVEGAPRPRARASWGPMRGLASEVASCSPFDTQGR
jgi:hypothetical protein